MVPMTPPRTSADDGPAALATALRSLADAVGHAPNEVPDETVREVVEALAAASGRVDAALAQWVGALDGRTIWAGDGARTAGAWLAARTELSSTRARATAASARDLARCPHVAAAWADGRLGTAKVRALLAARGAHRKLFAQHEQELVARLEPLTVVHATIAVARWEALAQATEEAEQRAARGGAADDANTDDGDDGASADPPDDPAADNAFHLSRGLRGRFLGDLDLDPVRGAELAEAITARIDEKFACGIYRADDGMTAAQRRAETLVELTQQGATPGRTKHGDPRPSVALSIDHRSLFGLPADDLADGLARRCEITVDGATAGTPVSPATAQRLLCTARVHALLVRISDDGEVETLGTTDLLRDATASQRRALAARDGGCAFPGCSAPPHWCEAHHLVPAELDGPTLMVNLALLCRRHHHLVHEGGWRLWRHDDGLLYLARPDGTLLPVTPHGAKTSGRPPVDPPAVPPPLPVAVRFRTERAP